MSINRFFEGRYIKSHRRKPKLDTEIKIALTLFVIALIAAILIPLYIL